MDGKALLEKGIMVHRIVEALQIVWDTVGADILSALGKDSLTREEVSVQVLDGGKLWLQDDVAAASFYRMPLHERNYILRMAFPEEEFSY